MKFIGPLEVHFQTLGQLEELVSLPFKPKHLLPHAPLRCEKCDTFYCSLECQANAGTMYHQMLCLGEPMVGKRVEIFLDHVEGLWIDCCQILMRAFD